MYKTIEGECPERDCAWKIRVEYLFVSTDSILRIKRNHIAANILCATVASTLGAWNARYSWKPLINAKGSFVRRPLLLHLPRLRNQFIPSGKHIWERGNAGGINSHIARHQVKRRDWKFPALLRQVKSPDTLERLSVDNDFRADAFAFDFNLWEWRLHTNLQINVQTAVHAASVGGGVLTDAQWEDEPQ